MKNSYKEATKLFNKDDISLKKKGFQIYKKLGKKNCLKSLRMLAYCYLNGIIVTKNIPKGIEYLTIICDNKNYKHSYLIAETCYYMSIAYMHGSNVKKNHLKSYNLLKKAKNLDYQKAKYSFKEHRYFPIVFLVLNIYNFLTLIFKKDSRKK